MNRIPRPSAPFILASTLALVGGAALPATAAFTPPSGWAHVTRNGTNFYGAPSRVNGFEPNINIQTHASTGSDDLTSVGRMLTKIGVHVDVDREISCAAGYRDRWLSYDTSMFNHQVSVVQFVVDTSKTMYVLTYMRAQGTPADAAAINALQSFCTR